MHNLPLQKKIIKEIREILKNDGVAVEVLNGRIYRYMLVIEKIGNGESGQPNNWPDSEIAWFRTKEYARQHFQEQINLCKSIVKVKDSPLRWEGLSK